MTTLKISGMTAAAPLTGSEIVAGLQNGNNVGITAQDIADLAGGGALLTTKVTISSAELLNINATPKTLIPAPGVGKLIIPITCVLVYRYGTTDYTGGVSLQLSPNNILFNVTFTNIISGSSNKMGTRTVAATATITSIFENLPFTITAASNPTGGDGTVDVYLSYYIADL